MKTLTLAIVIPAYNEEDHIVASLDSIARQTEKPDQVIVVDNNSTDNTAAIAASYPFVTLVKETTPGLIAARNTGFAHAHTDIVGRINAEAVLTENWVRIVKNRFMRDPELAGLAGVGHMRILPHLNHGYSTFWSLMYLLSAEVHFGVRVLWGANMAVRMSAWQKIFPDLQTDDKLVHEDLDISLCMAREGLHVENEYLMAMHSIKQNYFYFPKFQEYLIRRVRTKRVHKRLGTYDSPRLKHLSIHGRIGRAVLSVVPGLAFMVASPLFYPFLLLSRKLRRRGI